MELLPTSEDQLLDHHASAVCTLLRVFGIRVPPALYVPDKYDTVYGLLFDCDVYLQNYAIPRIEIAEMFYKAGFCQVEECDRSDSKNTLLMRMLTERDATTDTVKDKFRLLWWLIHWGAGLHRVKMINQGDCWIPWARAIHYVAASSLISKDIWQILRDENRSLSDSGSISTEREVKEVMHKVFSASTVDPCKCACSTSGCSSLIILPKQIMLEIDEEDNPALKTLEKDNSSREKSYWTIRACIVFRVQFLGSNTNIWKLLAPQIIRFAAFTTLELSHTCCVYHSYEEVSPHYFSPFNIEERQEIREEESAQIEELEILVAEFNRIYVPDVGNPMLDFFDGYWTFSMRKHREMNDIPYTKDELEKIRELGVRLSTHEVAELDDINCPNELCGDFFEPLPNYPSFLATSDSIPI